MNLFSPKTLNTTVIPNRIVMPPMVRYTKNGTDGFVTDALIAHYADCARGTGLTVVEATAVAPAGKLHANMIGLWCDEQIDGMARLAAAIHQAGARCMLQLCYAGLLSKDPKAAAVGPSEETLGARCARALTRSEIAAIEQLHVDAALRAQRAGFDGVELHGTHGYLNSRFLDASCNHRTDEYGGDAAGRTRMVLETLTQMRAAVGSDFLLSVRLGCNTPDFETAAENFQRIADMAPIDLIHLSRGNEMPPDDIQKPADFPGNTVVWYGARLAKLTELPVILSNEIRTPQQAARLIDEGYCDFAAVGRGILADAGWARKAKSGAKIVPCLDCAACQWRIDDAHCPGVIRCSKEK